MPASRPPPWHTLMSPACAALRDAAAAVDPANVTAVAKLRKAHDDPELVRLALLLAEARRKAASKFGDLAGTLVADPEGVEQASSLATAAVKAARFAELGATAADLCCGIGGDALALRRAGLGVLAVDRDPVRAWMTRQNTGAEAMACDVSKLGTPGGLDRPWHIDPARRTERGRVFHVADYQPGPNTLRGLLRQYPDAGIKLSPAVDLSELEEALPEVGEVQFTSEAGRLVQAVGWCGRPARSPRSAARVQGETVHHLQGDAENPWPDLTEPGRYLFTVDPAVERAGLIHELGLPMIHPSLGLVTADAPIASPWLTGFELLADMPYREKKLASWLRERGAGVVEVKTRGKAVEPDRLQRRLSGKGQAGFTVFVLRFDVQVRALVSRRV